MLTPEEQALLICARPRLTGHLRDRLCTLMTAGLDWNVYRKGAIQNLVVPLMAHHTLPIEAAIIPEDARNHIVAAGKRAVLRMMHIAALKHHIIKNVLLPRHCNFVELKGSSTSQALYGDAFIRQYRDIDLLVDSHRLHEISKCMLDDGWKVINKEWAPESGRTLDVLARYQAAIELQHQSGVVLELHRTVDNSGCVIDARDFLSRATRGPGSSILPLDKHVAYLCFHHSRHRWESLHWCGDAAAIAALPSEALERVLACGRTMGIESTIMETLKLAKNLTEIAESGKSSVSDPSRFLDDCIRALRKSVHPESSENSEQSNHDDRQPDFSYDWQRTRLYDFKFAVSRCRPTLNDYDWLPLPEAYHWLYWVTRPIRILSKVNRRK